MHFSNIKSHYEDIVPDICIFLGPWLSLLPHNFPDLGRLYYASLYGPSSFNNESPTSQ